MNVHSKIFRIQSNDDFKRVALEVFRFQFENLKVYREYISLLNISPESVDEIEKIPFLPISFFKTQKIVCENKLPEITFLSSGTSGAETSRHHVTNVQLYEQSFLKGFKLFYGNTSEYCILALLP